MKNKTVLIGLAGYLLLVLAGPVLKLLQVGPFGQWSWWWATALLWVPWVLVAGAVVYTVLGLLLTEREELEPRDE